MTAATKKSGPSGQKQPAYVTGTQQIDPQFWAGWDPALIASGDPRLIGEEMLRRYEAAGGEATGFWIILHDRDCAAEERDDHRPHEPGRRSGVDCSPKALHLHWIIKQSNGRNADGKLHCKEIDTVLGFSTSVTRAPGPGGRIENAQSYLIHAKDPNKFQYVPADVVTLRGQVYAEIEASHRRAWARRAVMGRTAAVSAREWAELGDVLVQRVLDGEVDELDLLRDKTLMDIYSRNDKKVDLALKNYARREMLFEVEKLRAGVFMKMIIWMMGASQQGKTYLAKGLVEALVKATGWRVYQPAAKNAADNYRGEEIMLLNEPGNRAFEWPDLLTLTGNREAGPLAARYANKGDVAPRVVIFAVAMDPVDFGFFVPGKRSTDDSLDQLLLRLSVLVNAEKINGEPRYSVSRMGEVPSYRRFVDLPGKYSESEVLTLTAGPISTVDDLNRTEAIESLVAEIVQRSPDAFGGIQSLTIES